MSDPNEDLLARGRAIFERLRSEPEPEPGPEELEPGGGHDAPAPEPVSATAEAEAEGLPEVVPDAVAEPETAATAWTPPEPAPPAVEPVPAEPPTPPVEAVLPQDEDLAVPDPVAEPAPITAVAEPAPIDPAAEPAPIEAVAAGPEPLTGPSPTRFARPLPRVIAVANQKGGVGKTTTAINLGACLADLDYRVLVVDLDPQGNATTGLGINVRNLQQSTYDVVMHDLPLEDCIEATSVRNLFLAPANLDLAGAEIELVPAFSRELKLRRALEEVLDDYDFVFIDCPPSLGLLTVNGLAAASEVLVPIQCEYYALEGLGQLLRNVTLVQKNLNPRLELSVIVLVMYDARTKLADQVVKEVRNHFGDKVCRNVVPRTVRLSEAPSFGQPIIAFDPTSRGAIAYRELAKEVSGGAPQRTR